MLVVFEVAAGVSGVPAKMPPTRMRPCPGVEVSAFTSVEPLKVVIPPEDRLVVPEKISIVLLFPPLIDMLDGDVEEVPPASRVKLAALVSSELSA